MFSPQDTLNTAPQLAPLPLSHFFLCFFFFFGYREDRRKKGKSDAERKRGVRGRRFTNECFRMHVSGVSPVARCRVLFTPAANRANSDQLSPACRHAWGLNEKPGTRRVHRQSRTVTRDDARLRTAMGDLWSWEAGETDFSGSLQGLYLCQSDY